MSNENAPFPVLSNDNRETLIYHSRLRGRSDPFIIFVAAKLRSAIYFKQGRPVVNTPIWVALFIYAAQLFLIIVLSLSKLSTTLLLWTLTLNKVIRQTCTITIAFTSTWTTFALGLAFRCRLPEPWLYTPDRCAGTIIYPMSALHILTEVIILVITFFMTCHVQMRLGKRVKILCFFSTRITHKTVFIALAIAQLALLPPFLNSPDTPWTTVTSVIFSQAMMYISVTIVCLPTICHISAGFHSDLLTTRLPDEIQLRSPKRSVYDSGRRAKSSFYSDPARFSNMAPSVRTDISSWRKNGDGNGIRRSSASTESMRHLTRVKTHEGGGVMKTVDITVWV
ncbi:uncharacterized protein BDW43DRAFT_306289 [Aspergillus alliaceus]|uniref:uncharacterized protein n=1 Tax=Petromyces alliaceus TaxID=209559 RepID=UPI0012A62E18|nr:uncharacterized protein BDW43DRAFT_306289 [Aspergillus alliaceus]KAB8238426.1 hypothetical protein BDW43DRAFT_306289 [Aspergillus alliaceus]